MAQLVTNPPVVQETWEMWVCSLGREDLRKRWQPIPVFFPGKSHGQIFTESDMTEAT